MCQKSERKSVTEKKGEQEYEWILKIKQTNITYELYTEYIKIPTMDH